MLHTRFTRVIPEGVRQVRDLVAGKMAGGARA